jgi:hypothetical protein
MLYLIFLGALNLTAVKLELSFEVIAAFLQGFYNA